MVRLAIQLRFEVIEETPVTPVFAFISVVRHLSQMFPVFVCVCASRKETPNERFLFYKKNAENDFQKTAKAPGFRRRFSFWRTMSLRYSNDLYIHSPSESGVYKNQSTSIQYTVDWGIQK